MAAFAPLYPMATGLSVMTAAMGQLMEFDLGQGFRCDCMLLSVIFLLTGLYRPLEARVARIVMAFAVLAHPALAHLPFDQRIS